MNVPTRRRPAILPTIATIAAVSVFVTAGLWQRDRMEQKLALRAQLDAAAARPLAPLPATGNWESLRFAPVTVTGTFDAAHQVFLDNRVHDGRAGFHVFTPLGLADGRTVLVNRGWVPGGATHAEVPKVAVPEGEVTVRGRVNAPPSALIELRHDAQSGPVWQNLDLGRYAAATGLSVLPIVIEQTAPLAASDSLVRDWPEPDLGVERHQSYMIQWFTFAVMAAGLWLYFTFIRKR